MRALETSSRNAAAVSKCLEVVKVVHHLDMRRALPWLIPLPFAAAQMRRYLVPALAFVAVTIPVAATAASTVVKPVVIQITVVNGKVIGGIKRPSVKKGRTVRFVIRTNAGTEVHLHGYEIEKIPRKGSPTVIQFVAKVTGRFELELHHPDALLAQLTVRP